MGGRFGGKELGSWLPRGGGEGRVTRAGLVEIEVAAVV